MGKKPADTVAPAAPAPKPAAAKPVAPKPTTPKPAAAAPKPAAPKPAAAAPKPAAPKIEAIPEPAPTAPTPAAPAPPVKPAPKPVEKPRAISVDSIKTMKPAEFSFSIERIALTKSLVKIIASLVDNLMFVFDNNGMHFVAIDSPHVAMFSMDLAIAFFSKFKITAPCTFNLEASDFSKILNRASVSDELVLSYNMKDDRVEETSVGKSKQKVKVEKNIMKVSMLSNKRARNFKIKNKDFGSTDVDDAKQALTFINQIRDLANKNDSSTFDITMDLFDEIVKDALLVGDLADLIADAGSQTVALSNIGDAGDYDGEITKENVTNTKIMCNMKATFSLSYLESVLPLGTFSPVVHVTMMDNKPLILDFDLMNEEGSEQVGIFTFVLAPRVEEQVPVDDTAADINEEGDENVGGGEGEQAPEDDDAALEVTDADLQEAGEQAPDTVPQ